MIGDEAKTALLVPARAMQGANDVNRPVGRSVRSLDQVGMHGVGAGNGVKAGNGLRLTHLPGSNRASRSNTTGGKQDTPDVETTNRRAVCGKTARTVRREGRAKALPCPYPALPQIMVCGVDADSLAELPHGFRHAECQRIGDDGVAD